jgi:hypothetical protein
MRYINMSTVLPEILKRQCAFSYLLEGDLGDF